MKAFFFVLCLLFSFSLFGNIFFDENIPEELRSKITAFYKESKTSINFLIEMPDENTISIVAENGFVRTLPIKEITAEDVCNLMEEMVAVVYEKDENSDKIPKDSEKLAKIKNLSSKWQKDEFKESFYAENEQPKSEKPKPIFLKGGIKLTDRIEFFPWVKKSDRFGISLFATSEEKWAFGLKFSVGFSFLRVGARFKKGINLKLADNSVPWESYSLNLQFDIIDLYNVRFSTGFEVALYSAKGVLFHREFFVFRLAYRIKWFEAAASFNVSPTNIELGLFGATHEMQSYNFMLSTVFLF